MVLDRNGGPIRHQHFSDLPGLLRPGDLLVLNRSAVQPNRLFALRGHGTRTVELLVLSCNAAGLAEALVRGGGRLRSGERLRLLERSGRASASIAVFIGSTPNGTFLVQWPSLANFEADRNAMGRAPLPPYIKRGKDEDPLPDLDRYQAVYAEEQAGRGSIAAPTAGLHFTPSLLDELERKGIGRAFVELEVGAGTFAPVRVESIAEHVMHAERYHIPPETAAAVNRAKQEGRRVVCVGTTAVRACESSWSGNHLEAVDSASTQLFITPGYRFRAPDGMITNFHLPESTLLMLVSAFAGYETTMTAYRKAVEEGYRFFSYGDAMLIE